MPGLTCHSPAETFAAGRSYSTLRLRASPHRNSSAGSTPLRGESTSAWKASQTTPRTDLLDAIEIRPAETAAELRAAAGLRAVAFYTYPAGRSEFSTQAHRRMKADEEWRELEEKTTGKHPQYKGIHVTCLIATVGSRDDKALQAVRQQGDLSCQLPAANGQPPHLVVATLDLNQGPKLPSETLMGRLPAAAQAGAASSGRTYLSNVCTAPAVRRQGVAAHLVKAACEHAALTGTGHLYVHVAADNIAAQRLYLETCGFALEQVEDAAIGRAMNRPQHSLLHRQIDGLHRQMDGVLKC